MTPSTAVTTQPAAIPVVRGPVAARDHLIRIGTRGSELAVTQTTGVARQIAAATGWDVALVIITTKGDTSPAPLAQLGGTGVFVSALRDALLAGQCDLAVHSLKDLPTGECAGITLGAIPVRADARDALCARDGLTLAELPAGARVGTGSPRRSAQLLGQRPDLDVRDLRGNVDSRLARVTNDLDAVVLAAAGLLRIGRDPAITEYFALDAVPTAPGQGALAIEARSGDVLGAGAGADVDANADAGPADAAHAAAQSVADHSAPPRPRSGVLATAITAGLAALDDPEARACALAERSVLATLEAGCQAPVGAWARREGDQLVLTGVVYETGGARHVSETRHVAWPELRAPANAAVNAGSGTAANAAAAETVAMRLGAEVARALLESGAAELAPLTLMTGLGGQLATTAHPAPHTRQTSPGTTQNGATR